MLKAKGVPFREVEVVGGTPEWQAMEALTGGKTVPQVVVDGRPFGDHRTLQQLEQEGRVRQALLGEE